jgi:predicted transcriptional regulator
MARNTLSDLSRRERQIMEALYRRGRATVAEVRDDLPDPPTDAAVRAALLLLEDKGHVRSSMRGQRSVYTPAVAATTARRRALRDLVTTFFRGSRADAMAELLSEVTDQELDRVEELLRRRRAEERGR